MFGWLFGPKADARQLNRDVKTILNTTRYGFRTEMQREIAWTTHQALREAHERGGDGPSAYKPLIDHFKMMHRDARRAHNQVQLTANTFVIIYLRAEQLEDLAAPARKMIDDFIADWAHTFDEHDVQRPM